MKRRKNKKYPRRVAPAAFRSRPAKTQTFSSSSDLQSRACALTFFFPAARFFTKKKTGKKVPAERDEREADQTFRSRNRPTEICQNEEEEEEGTFLAATAGHPGRRKKKTRLPK
jgi:hypothetical protein